MPARLPGELGGLLAGKVLGGWSLGLATGGPKGEG
jgi:hypothetical protein